MSAECTTVDREQTQTVTNGGLVTNSTVVSSSRRDVVSDSGNSITGGFSKTVALKVLRVDLAQNRTQIERLLQAWAGPGRFHGQQCARLVRDFGQGGDVGDA